MANQKDTRATESDLGGLHGLVARALSAKLESGDFTAADINAAIKFLKDNNIDCAGSENPDIMNLVEGLPVYEDPEGVDVLN